MTSFDIHLIEKSNNLKVVDKKNLIWESYAWKVSAQTAEKLIGGNIYLHSAQDKPSHFGGKILGYRFINDENDSAFGRVVFIFEASLKCKNVVSNKEGWSMEKKLVAN